MAHLKLLLLLVAGLALVGLGVLAFAAFCAGPCPQSTAGSARGVATGLLFGLPLAGAGAFLLRQAFAP